MNLSSNSEPGHTPRLVILISGSGSNMLAIAEAVAEGQLDASIAAVICNRPDAAGLQKARERGLETALLDHKEYPSREAFDAALMELIDRYDPDLVVLAGFMRILTPALVAHYQGRMLNIHPSLLPKYQGLHTHQRALDAGDHEHGVTVHFVTEVLDDGPNVIQAVVPVYDGDDATSLQQRVHQQEHIIYPIAIKWFTEGRLRMDTASNTALLDGNPLPAPGLQLRD